MPQVDSLRKRADHYSAAQRRTIDAALQLFAVEGVAGTSLQMIADAVGVTKAAIYYQFNAKDDIVVAVLEVNLAPLEEALEAAEASPRTTSTREVLLRRIIQQAVTQRGAVGMLQNDPVLIRLLGTYEPSKHLWSRLFAFIVGSEDGARARARAAALSAAIGSVGHPFVADLTDDVLCDELFAVARRIVQLRP